MLFFLFFLIMIINIHYYLNRDKIKILSTFPYQYLSVEWFEPRVRVFERAQNSIYPELLPIDRLGFVYEK